MTALWLIVLCGVLSIVYAAWATSSVLKADAGNARMQEIAAAVREGAQAYLKRQYMTIGIVGVVIFALLAYFLGMLVAFGFLIGAVLSGAAGSISPSSPTAWATPPTAAPWSMRWWPSASAPR
jgi:K(+)-stimulated pyrophosphate-energized sodium pump